MCLWAIVAKIASGQQQVVFIFDHSCRIAGIGYIASYRLQRELWQTGNIGCIPDEMQRVKRVFHLIQEEMLLDCTSSWRGILLHVSHRIFLRKYSVTFSKRHVFQWLRARQLEVPSSDRQLSCVWQGFFGERGGCICSVCSGALHVADEICTATKVWQRVPMKWEHSYLFRLYDKPREFNTFVFHRALFVHPHLWYTITTFF